MSWIRNFSRTSDEETSYASQGTQTLPVSSSNCSNQCPEVLSTGCQTTLGQETSATETSKLYDQAVVSGRLKSFLLKCLPIVLQEIRESMSQDWEAIERCLHASSYGSNGDFGSVAQTHTIYGDYLIQLQEEMMNRESSKESTTSVKKRAQSAISTAGRIFDTMSTVNPGISPDKKLVITSLDWNCSSSLMVIGHGIEVKHIEWCSHESYLFVYSLYRDYGRESPPSLCLDVDGCVSIIKCHPEISFLFAVGCYSGRVCLVDISQKTISDTSIQHHEDSVSGLNWTSGIYIILVIQFSHLISD